MARVSGFSAIGREGHPVVSTSTRNTATGRQRPPLILCLAVLALLLAIEPATAAEKSAVGGERPNIIFILIDTLRADHLGCYDYVRDTSPTIDDIAAEGLVFTDAVAPAPHTTPSVASIFTSLYPDRHGVAVGDDERDPKQRDAPITADVLGNSVTTLAEALGQVGYTTAGFVANPWLNSKHGFGQGFDVYDDATGRKTRSGEEINLAAMRWLRQREGGGPFFLYMHYMEVHGPYNAPAKFRGPFEKSIRKLAREGKLTPLPADVKGFRARLLEDVNEPLVGYLEYWVARYDAGIRQCDTYIAALRESLRELGVWDKALIVITADHGEELAEHGAGGHGRNLHVHQLHVPLIIRSPREIEPARIDVTVSLLDIAPTLWEAAGVELPSDIQGRSLLPMIRFADQRQARIAFAEAVRNKPSEVSVQYLGRKLMADAETGERRFYDLRDDPMEQRPSVVSFDEVTTRLQATLDVWLRDRETHKPSPNPKVAIDPETEQLLRRLGYLEGED